uniref:Uncharacterized protein n=1 Tax=Panagrolaimus sp. ES5 TaxID=591445 RepID=A0AC34G1L6_9BILA
MILSKEFFDECSPSYQKAIKDFEQKVSDIESQDEVNQEVKAAILKAIFDEFVANYYAPKKYWKRFYKCDDFKFFENSGYTELYVYFRQHKRTIQDKKEHDSNKYLYVSEYGCITDSGNWNILELEFEYPHSHLLHFFHNFKKYSTCSPSKKLVQRYDEMKLLYSKIKAAKDDVETWFKLLIEVGIEDFVVHVVEYRIVCNLNDQKLWKLYIEYLKEVDPNKMLKWYSKYCRFFLDDFEMKAKYETEMKEYGPVKLSWANLFEFEKGFILDKNENDNSNEKSDKAVQNDENQEGQTVNVVTKIEANSRPLKDICAEFDITAINQIFSLPKPIIKYVLESADHMYIEILLQDLSFDELLLLIGHGNVVDLQLEGSDICDVDGSLVALEKIMEYLPNVEKLNMFPVRIGKNTANALANMNFNAKIYCFDLLDIQAEPFDPDEFLKFIIANRSEYFEFVLLFKRNHLNIDFFDRFEKLMDDLIIMIMKSLVKIH